MLLLCCLCCCWPRCLVTALTDIPDWCYIESGLQFEAGHVPTPDEYAHMLRISPIAHVSRVRAPLLLMVGTADARVPLAQGLDYARILRARGGTVRTLMYPDSQHSLNDKLSFEIDVYLNSFLWMSHFVRNPTSTAMPSPADPANLSIIV
jgi:acylaminoacyl-peptidase